MSLIGSAARRCWAGSKVEREVARERLQIIRASEVGEYVYCARAWWLRRVAGLEPAGHARREHGTALHRRHGRAVMGSWALLLLGGLLAVVALALIILGR
jgi:CRISPR/Cas system-associated exonuclease Cas4 (RecB family)